jgi:hypothetical protein
MTRLILSTLLALATLTTRADPVLDWNEALLRAARASSVNPPVFTRNSAILHLAIFDAVNGIQRTHRPYHVTDLAPAGASVEAAISAAAHRSLMTLVTNVNIQQTNFTALRDASLAAIPDSPAKTAGIDWGTTVADRILELRSADGWNSVVAYTNAPVPGIWRPTPPANAPGLLPGWGRVTPFCMPSGTQFQPHKPPGLTSSAYTFEYEIVRQLGAKQGSTRTDDQSEIALFWSDGGGTETPPGHWNHIAQDVSKARGLSIAENARLFALLNLALADAGICCWDAKFVHNLWRPVTAIREADTDGNPETTPDPAWESFIGTPPFPEYTSGHATFSRASATVLANFFGTDEIAFTSTSDGLPGVTRNYSSFSAAADESGISRIYGGIHWPSANIAGQTAGHFIGTEVSSFFLLPLSAPTFGLIKVAGQVVDLTLMGEAGRTYRFEGSANLSQWIELGTATAAASGEVQFQDTTQEPFRFYRALEL